MIIREGERERGEEKGRVPCLRKRPLFCRLSLPPHTPAPSPPHRSLFTTLRIPLATELAIITQSTSKCPVLPSVSSW